MYIRAHQPKPTHREISIKVGKDDKLSMAAKGLYFFMLTLEVGEEISEEEIRRLHPELSLEKVYELIEEVEGRGYTFCTE